YWSHVETIGSTLTESKDRTLCDHVGRPYTSKFAWRAESSGHTQQNLICPRTVHLRLSDGETEVKTVELLKTLKRERRLPVLFSTIIDFRMPICLVPFALEYT